VSNVNVVIARERPLAILSATDMVISTNLNVVTGTLGGAFEEKEHKWSGCQEGSGMGAEGGFWRKCRCWGDWIRLINGMDTWNSRCERK
jgi:hypothetical protein